MSRSGYSDDCEDYWAMIRWRGAVASAIRGKRGQAFLKEMLAAIDAIPTKQLISHELESLGGVCAIGSVGRRRGLDMSAIDPYDRDTVAGVFGIPPALAAEIMYENDLSGTPEHRWCRIRSWVESQIRAEADDVGRG